MTDTKHPGVDELTLRMSSTLQETSLSRRSLIRTAAVATGALTVGSLLAACAEEDDEPEDDDDAVAVEPDDDDDEEPEDDDEPADDDEEPAEEPTDVSVLNIDAGTTGGGGGRAGTPLSGYCYVETGGSMFEVFRMVDSRLFAWTADMADFVPEVAESWETDGTTVTFHLRENAMWHDDEPVTAQDVLFTLNLIANPESGSRYAGTLGRVEGYDAVRDGDADELEGATAPDEHTVVLELTSVDSALLPGLPFMMLIPEHHLGDVPPAEITEQQFWVDGRIGCGPYRWKQLVEGERIELEAFDDYFLGRPNIDEINLLLFETQETSVAGFEAGSNLGAPLTADNYEYVEAMDHSQVETMSTGVLAIFVNTEQEELSDHRVRQAMMYAIDQDAIAETMYGGVAAETTYWNIPWFDWVETDELIRYDYDPDRALELMEEAGYPDGFQIENFWYYYPDAMTESVMEAMQQYLGAIGIEATPRLDDGASRVQEMDAGDWYITYGAWGINPAPEMDTIWTCDAPGIGYPCIPEYDELLDAARSTFDEEEQQDLYRQAVAIHNEQLPSLWMFDRQNIVAVNVRLDTGDNPAWGAGHLMYHNFAEEWTLADE